VAAVGMAMPGLRRCLRELTLVFGGDPTDLESEIAKGFLEALYAVDPAEWALCARLVRAAHKAGTRLVYAEAAFDGARWGEYHSRAPVPPWGHPDFLLLGAVDAGVITDAEARSPPAPTASFPGCGIIRQTSAASRVARGSSGPAAPVMSAIPIGPRTEEGALPGPPPARRPLSAGRGPHPQPRPVEAGGP